MNCTFHTVWRDHFNSYYWGGLPTHTARIYAYCQIFNIKTIIRCGPKSNFVSELSKLERQQATLVLNMFDESTIATLLMRGNNAAISHITLVH